MKIAVSPCPNDTFAFYHLLHRQSNFATLSLDIAYEDVQSLNERAINSDGDLLKISFAVYPLVQNEYILLNAGVALGQGCGPLCIGLKNETINLHVDPVLIPGKNTTAHRLFKTFYPDNQQVRFTTYDQVMNKLLSKEAKAGVIIHESRFTYQQYGLQLLADLGSMWEKQFFFLLPLGGIIAKRSLGQQKLQSIQNSLVDSIQWAFSNANDKDLWNYMKNHAQEMDQKVIQQHIDLYVNQFTLHLGSEGQEAIMKLLNLKKDSAHQYFLSEESK